MRLSHAAASAYYEYTFITGNGSRSWQADEDAVSDVIISTREYGPVPHVHGEILQLTHEDRNDGCDIHFATVCACNDWLFPMLLFVLTGCCGCMMSPVF